MYLFIWFQLCRIYKETKLQNTRSLCFYCRICNTVLFHFISVTQLVERKQKPEFVRQTSINHTADGKQSTNSFRCLSSACLFLTLPRRWQLNSYLAWTKMKSLWCNRHVEPVLVHVDPSRDLLWRKTWKKWRMLMSQRSACSRVQKRLRSEAVNRLRNLSAQLWTLTRNSRQLINSGYNHNRTQWRSLVT